MTIKKQNQNLSGDAQATDLNEVEQLQEILQRQQTNGKLTQTDLYALARLQEQKTQQTKAPLLQRLEQRKGFLNFWYIKVPLRVLNVNTISQNQKFIHDTLRTLRSPQCPMCNKGILMHDLAEVPVGGNVRWFCSEQPSCMFSVLATPSSHVMGMSGLDEVLQQSVHVLGRDRWAALSEEEKNELIENHLFKGILYRNFSIALAAILLIQCALGAWLSILMTFGLTALTLLLSFKWCYRAWQIKTGNVFPQESLFFEWLKTAEQYYSLEWVDAPAEDQND